MERERERALVAERELSAAQAESRAALRQVESAQAAKLQDAQETIEALRSQVSTHPRPPP